MPQSLWANSMTSGTVRGAGTIHPVTLVTEETERWPWEALCYSQITKGKETVTCSVPYAEPKPTACRA